MITFIYTKFEVFVDADGTNHNYKEVRFEVTSRADCYVLSLCLKLIPLISQFEINALGTTWSLLLNKPYGDSGGENSKRVDPDGK